MSNFRKTLPYSSPQPRTSRPPSGPGSPGQLLARTPLPAQLDPSRARPPAGRRVARLEPDPPDSDLSDNAPGWMQRAHHMANALGAAVASGQVSPGTEAAIERAWAAWELNGVSDRQIAAVAHLAARAHAAIHEPSLASLDRRVADCALVLHGGLPPALRRRVAFEFVVEVVRELAREADPWPAIVNATARLLGWVTAAQAHAAQAVRTALEQRSSR